MDPRPPARINRLYSIRSTMQPHVYALALAATCALGTGAAAQSKPTEVYVSVADGKGNPAAGLTAQDFRVREDGVAREVLTVAPATEPLTVALLVDDTQAAMPALPMMREAIDAFLTALGGKADIALVTFGDRPTIAVDYTTDQKKLHDGAHRIFPRSNAGGVLMDAIVEVSKGLQKREAKRPVIVVLMMDGSIEFSNRNYQNVLDDINQAGAVLHVVSLGTPSSNGSDEVRNRNQLIAAATERTGGRREQVLPLTGATPKMQQVADDLLHQYVLTYARPATLIPPDKIEVSVTKPGLTARARTRTGAAGAR
jgi:VWFA-related protein